MDSSSKTEGWKGVFASGVLARFAILCLGLWLHAASMMLAATTLPRAVDDIGGAHLVGWTFSLYLVGSIVAGAITGFVVVRAGLRFALFGAALLYGLGSIGCALAPDMSVFLAGRLVQGVGGGWLVALTYVAITRLFPQELTPRLIALTSAVWSASAFCGPLIGGTFSTVGLWRFAYLAFAAQAVIFLVAVYFLFVESDDSEPALVTNVPLVRVSLLAAAVLCVAVAGAEIDGIRSPILCVIGVGLLGIFIRVDGAQSSSRMFPARPFDLRHTTGAGLLFVITASAATMSFVVYGPFLLETLYGVTPLAAGYIVALESVSWGVAAILCAGVGEQYERWLIRLGSVTVALGLIGFAMFIPGGPLWAVLLCAIAQGAGFGMMWGFLVRRIIAASAPGERDVASSALPTTQQLGFAMGAAGAGIVANSVGFDGELSIAIAKKTGFWVFVAFMPLALFAIYAAWRLTAKSP